MNGYPRLAVEKGADGMNAEQIAGLRANAVAVAAAEAARKTEAAAAFRAACEKCRDENPGLDAGSGPAVAAKNLRKLLKAAFPGVKFSVTISRFAGGNSMTVRWTDGPTRKAVEAIALRFKDGTFNGMTDSYEYQDNPWNILFGSAKYVSCTRSISDALADRAIALVAAEYGELNRITGAEFNAGKGCGKSPVSDAWSRRDWQSLTWDVLANLAAE